MAKSSDNRMIVGLDIGTSKVVAVVDSFDAMTTERVYQRAMDTYPALRIMFSLRGAYDEDILRAFVELMGPSGLAEL